MPMRQLFWLGLVLIASLAGAAVASAGEADARARTQAAAAALPAPTTQAGFEYPCYVLRAGAPYGRLTLSAYPEQRGERVRWRVREAIVPIAPGGEHVVAQALLAADLRGIEGRYNRRNKKGFLEARWKRAEGGQLELRHTTQDYENRLQIPAAAATSTLPGLLLFLRQIPAGPGVYLLEDFEPNPAAGDEYVAPMYVEVHRKAGWKVGGTTRQAWIVSVSRGNQTLRLALDGETRAFLGAVFLGTPFQFVPQGSGPVGLADPGAKGLETPVERARLRARALRNALPAPKTGFRWRGDLRLGDTRVGSVVLEAAPSAFGERAGWAVLESRTSRTGEAVVVLENSGLLKRDLSILRGQRTYRSPAGESTSTYVRKPEGMETVYGAAKNSAAKKRLAPTLVAAPEDAVTGIVSILLFLRAVPEKQALYVLPGFDPRVAGTPKAGTGSLVYNRADVRVEVRGRVPFRDAGKPVPSLLARCSYRNGRSYDIHLDPESRDLLGVIGRFPTLSYLPHDPAARPVTWYDAIEGDPATARQAFVKFGRGYHRPRRDLLADAIHWPSLAKQVIANGSYAEGTPEAKIREDWIDVFVGMSKHRTKGDCDDLLFQIFMTSTETQNEDGSVTLQTLPVYGGHTYRCQKIGTRWYIVAID